MEMNRSGLAAHKLQRIFALVDAHIAETMHVRDLAQAIGLSPFHFARMFKKSTGHSPHAYITLRRMELARALLADSSLSLVEVGAKAGYQTQAHFTDVFRKMNGMTPGRYRRKTLEDRLAIAAVTAVAGAPAEPVPLAPTTPPPAALEQAEAGR